MINKKYIDYIIKKGINLQKNQPVEIVCSSYLNEFIQALKHACLENGASNVYIRYTDGIELESKIRDGYSRHIDMDIRYYKELVKMNFCRITIHSPFLSRMVLSDHKIMEYQKEVSKLYFVQDYFLSLQATHTICAASNPYWAAKLQLTEDALWEKIIEVCVYPKKIEHLQHWLNSLHIEKLYFKTSLGTNLEVSLIPNSIFQGREQLTKNNIAFQPNIPCNEIYISPDKYGVSGKLVSSKPLAYRGIIIPSYEIEFKDGRVSSAGKLTEIITKLFDEGLYYGGEISIVEYEKNYFYSTLLDENMGCHLALGASYPYGSSNLDRMNVSKHHIDLIFGTKDIDITAKTNEKKQVPILHKGRFCDEE